MGKIHAGRPDKIFISLITHSYHMLILFALNTGVPTMDVFVVGERRMSALIATKKQEQHQAFVVSSGRRLSTLISTEKTRSSIQVFLPPCGAVIIHTRSYSPPFVGREQAK